MEKREGGREKGMGRGAERHYAYENVLKEVWFMYALDADSITGQWLKWDLSRNTEATWSDSVSLLAIWATGKLLTEERKKRERRHIYNLNTHLTHRERVNCNLPSKTTADHRQAFAWKTSGREREEQGEKDGKKSVNMCPWITVVNCAHCWAVFGSRFTTQMHHFQPKRASQH